MTRTFRAVAPAHRDPSPGPGMPRWIQADSSRRSGGHESFPSIQERPEPVARPRQGRNPEGEPLLHHIPARVADTARPAVSRPIAEPRFQHQVIEPVLLRRREHLNLGEGIQWKAEVPEEEKVFIRHRVGKPQAALVLPQEPAEMGKHRIAWPDRVLLDR